MPIPSLVKTQPNKQVENKNKFTMYPTASDSDQS